MYTKTIEGQFNFWYPRHIAGEVDPPDHAVTHCRLGLMDVRAADDLIVSYDFERDGWMIEQETGAVDENGSATGEKVEVAFVKAWASWKEKG